MADDTKSSQKTYHKKATGDALVTAKKHAKDHDLKLYGSCFWYVESYAETIYNNSLIMSQSFRAACLDIFAVQRSRISIH